MITASLVIYNQSLKDIELLLQSLQISEVSIIFLLDNSPIARFKYISEKYNKVSYVVNKKNIGFGAAHNLAIKEAIRLKGSYHIVINPDISFNPDAISYLASFMRRNSGIGMLMPQILYPNGETQYLCKLLPSPLDLIGRRFVPSSKFVERRNELYELRRSNYNSQMDVPSLSGCFMFLRTSVLAKVGGFDERFFMYAEDVDLCRRVSQVSRVVYYPRVSIIHRFEKGSYKNFKLLSYHVISAIKYFNKWGWVFDPERRKVNRRVVRELFGRTH